MHYLPIGPASDPGLAVPLSRAAAESLLSILASVPGESPDACERSLRHDPPLVLWLVLEVVGEAASRALMTVEDLAARLSAEQVASRLAVIPRSWSDNVADGKGSGGARLAQLADFPDDGLLTRGTADDPGIAAVIARALAGLQPEAQKSLPEWVLTRWGASNGIVTTESPGPEARERCDDDPHQQPAGRLGDALILLARRIARLSELETAFSAQLERDKMAALKELAYGASHEINNPLSEYFEPRSDAATR